MDYKKNEQIENILKKSAEEIKIKPFADRWKNIESRLDFNRGEGTIIEEKVPVLATQNTGSVDSDNRSSGIKRNIIFIVLCLCFVIILAILVPVFVKKSEPAYFEPSELIYGFVSEEEFYETVKNSGIDIVDINRYEYEEFSLLKTVSGEIHGGKFSINDMDNMMIIQVTFYSSSVIISDTEFINANKHQISDTEILYKKLENDDLIQYKAFAKHNNVTYLIEYMSLADNLLDFLDQFFA